MKYLKNINEKLGIPDIVIENTEHIIELFKKKSYSSNNNYIFNNKKITINFNLLNNYYANFIIDVNKNYIVNLGIPHNYRENKLKQVISHELTHVYELLSITYNTAPNMPIKYPKYNSIKKALNVFNPQTRELQVIKQFIYMTLDNEINANVAQTYFYLKNFGNSSKFELLDRLEEYSDRKTYKDIILLAKNHTLLTNKIINSPIAVSELLLLDKLLKITKTKTPDISDISKYIDDWFVIFSKKANKVLKRQSRILAPFLERIKTFTNYVNTYTLEPLAYVSYEDYLIIFNT